MEPKSFLFSASKSYLMKQLSITLLLFVGFGLFGCVNSGQNEKLKSPLDEFQKSLNVVNYKTVTIDSLGISLQLPEGMQATKALDADSPIQFQDGSKERYLVGMHENAADAETGLELMGFDKEGQSLLENYMDFTEGSLKESIKVTKLEARKSKFIDGNEALMIQLDGTVEGVLFPISYFVTVVETRHQIYKFVSWTLLSKKDDFRAIDEKMIQSIRFK
jgi:hypothetical protein